MYPKQLVRTIVQRLVLPFSSERFTKLVMDHYEQ